MISHEEVLHIARLAKLRLAEEEVELYREQLGRILEYFKKLEELDTSDVEPLKYVLDVGNVLRADEPRPSLPLDEVLKNAPKSRDGFFEVPKVIEK
jgi:aspartyl-tRNA(Asn)/glutamyl-tRNA(Gln) amidotransferase subunit C